MLNSQGVRLFAAGERAKAARCFAGALRLDPNDHNSLMSLGALASSEGRPSEALALYDRIATAQLKEDALADWAGARALVLDRLGRADDARRQLREALARKDLPAAKRARLSEYLQGLRGA